MEHARRQQMVAKFVDYLHRELAKKFKGGSKPVKVSAFAIPFTNEEWAEVAARLASDGWTLEFPTLRHPLRWMWTTLLIWPAR